MFRRLIFWVHLTLGVASGIFIFIMAATGAVLAFERQIADFVDRDIRTIAEPNPAQQRSLNDLLESVRRADVGEPTAIVVRNEPQAAVQFSIGRGKAIYVDPYSGAILGSGSVRVREFFSQVERWHRSLGTPLGSRGLGHWLAAISNLLFGGLIILGIVLWVPRRWNWKAFRASLLIRGGLRGKARDWNWHNAIGIWCAGPLLVIVLTGVVMSYPWANALLFRLSGSAAPVQGRGGFGEGRDGGRGRGNHSAEGAAEPAYDKLMAVSKGLNPKWRTITLNVGRSGSVPVQASVDAGTGGQPQKRGQYLLDRESGVVLKATTFSDGNLGQRLRAFVRFGHTGEWGGWLGQLVAGLASLGACVLVYSGLALSIRRLVASVRRRRGVGLVREESARVVV